MKTLFSTLLLFVFAMTVSVQTVSANAAISKKETREVIMEKVIKDQSSFITKIKESKRAQKMMKKYKSMQEKVDFKDPVNKWMWFWIFGWAIGFILYSSYWVVGGGLLPVWYIGHLAWLAGTVCGVIFLLKKLDAM